MALDTYLLKAPKAILHRWRTEASRRGVSLAQFIRETLNREVDDVDRERRQKAMKEARRALGDDE